MAVAAGITRLLLPLTGPRRREVVGIPRKTVIFPTMKVIPTHRTLSAAADGWATTRAAVTSTITWITHSNMDISVVGLDLVTYFTYRVEDRAVFGSMDSILALRRSTLAIAVTGSGTAIRLYSTRTRITPAGTCATTRGLVPTFTFNSWAKTSSK